jgi:hypothetical protein
VRKILSNHTVGEGVSHTHRRTDRTSSSRASRAGVPGRAGRHGGHRRRAQGARPHCDARPAAEGFRRSHPQRRRLAARLSSRPCPRTSGQWGPESSSHVHEWGTSPCRGGTNGLRTRTHARTQHSIAAQRARWQWYLQHGEVLATRGVSGVRCQPYAIYQPIAMPDGHYVPFHSITWGTIHAKRCNTPALSRGRLTRATIYWRQCTAPLLYMQWLRAARG